MRVSVVSSTKTNPNMVADALRRKADELNYQIFTTKYKEFSLIN